jgi:hypothetical protein
LAGKWQTKHFQKIKLMRMPKQAVQGDPRSLEVTAVQRSAEDEWRYRSMKADLLAMMKHQPGEPLKKEVDHPERVVADVGVHVRHGVTGVHHKERNKWRKHALHRRYNQRKVDMDEKSALHRWLGEEYREVSAETGERIFRHLRGGQLLHLRR